MHHHHGSSGLGHPFTRPHSVFVMALQSPTESPTLEPTFEPTAAPTEEPTAAPTEEPTAAPTAAPTLVRHHTHHVSCRT
jgi:hypothetical protein